MAIRDLLGIPARQSTVPATRSAGGRASFRRPVRRSWDPTQSGRLFGDFAASTGSADEELRGRLDLERARSRTLERVNPWAVRFYTVYLSNVFGADGIRLVPRVTTLDRAGPRGPRMVPDQAANEIIQTAWLRWARHGEPTVDGRCSWPGLQRLMGISLKRDGEALARIHRGRQFGEFGYQLQLLEADHLPTQLSRELQSGHRIQMGIERDALDRPAAYWLSKRHPGSRSGFGVSVSGGSLDQYERIPADEVIHFYSPKRIGQSRGLPSLESGIASLHMLAGYEEAELVAARAASSKMGWVQSETGDGYTGDGEAGPGGDKMGDGSIPETLEPGVIGQLAAGQTFEGWDPQHPTTSFGSFVKWQLRRFASAAGINYNTLANDLEGVNFSSLRQGALAERDGWKDEQALFVEVVCERVYDGWLEAALLGNRIALPLEKLEKFRGRRWQGRRWEWIDPVKEAQAAEIAIDNCTTSVSAVIRSQGRDPREVFEEIAADRELAEQLGVAEFLPYMNPKRPSAPGAAADEGAQS